jgi:hypothetical protein
MCSEECTDTCKAIIDNVYAGCSAMDTTTNDGGDVSTAQEIESASSIFRNDDCNNYADTKSFKIDRSDPLGSTPESSPTSAAPESSPTSASHESPPTSAPESSPTSAPAGDGLLVV